MSILGANRFSKHTFLVSFLIVCGSILHVIWLPEGPPRGLILEPQMISPFQSQLSFLNALFPPALLFHLVGFLILFAGYAHHHRQKIHKDGVKRDADFRRQLQVFVAYSREALDVLLTPLMERHAIHDLDPKTGVQILTEAQQYLWVIDSLIALPFEIQAVDVKQRLIETISIWHLHHPQGKVIVRLKRGAPHTLKANPFLVQVALLSVIAFSAGAYPDDAHRIVIDVEGEEDQLMLSFRDRGITLAPHKRFDFYREFYPGGHFPVYEDLAVSIESLQSLVQKLGGDIDFSVDPVTHENLTLLTLPIS